MSWLAQVGGELYRSRHPDNGNTAWVAVVRTPWQGARRGKLIIALGSTAGGGGRRRAPVAADLDRVPRAD